MPYAQETLAAIATRQPTSTRVFLRHRLDFCCGGRATLTEACEAAGLASEVVAAELEAELAGNPDVSGANVPGASLQRWDERPIEELIDHIERRYHAALRRDLPGLVAAAERVEKVHAEKPTCPRGLAALLRAVHLAVEEHLLKEEMVLFPMLRAGRRGSWVHMPVRVLGDEHVEHGESLARIRSLTGDLTAPPEACGTWRALYDGLQHLEEELMEHIHLENNILFPRGLGA